MTLATDRIWTHPLLRRSAEISDDGIYRYRLDRDWTLPRESRVTACFTLLNPSKADAMRDDQTARRCMGFAARWGMTAISIVNLFAWRSTDPVALAHSARAGRDVVGALNDVAIAAAAAEADLIVCAWSEWYRRVDPERPASVLRILHEATALTPMMLRLTQRGDPAHPARLPYALPLMPYMPR